MHTPPTDTWRERENICKRLVMMYSYRFYLLQPFSLDVSSVNSTIYMLKEKRKSSDLVFLTIYFVSCFYFVATLFSNVSSVNSIVFMLKDKCDSSD